MEEKIVQPWAKGLILSLVTIVYSLALYLTGQWQNQSLSWISYIIIIGGLIWACIHYAKQMNGNVSFGNVFAYGFKMTAALIVITVIYTVISIKFLFPEMTDKIMEVAAKKMEEKKNLTDEQINQALEFTKKNLMPFTIGGIIFAYALLGAIGSVLGAAIAKKNPNPNPFEQN